MRPLIVAATEQEIKNSIPYLGKNDISYLITGVGMTATTFALTKKLTENNQFDYILNVGIAGSLDKNIQLGDIVEINKDIFSELGAEDDDSFIKIEDMGFGIAAYENIKHSNLKTDLPKYTGITVNTIHGQEQSINRVKNLFPNAAIETMEGAAIFFVCKQLNLPSLQVRSISNYVEKRDKSTWNIPLAIKNLNDWLISHLQKDY